MKKTLIFCSSLLLSSAIFAQVPEDAIKYSWQPVNGTARIAAVGGAMGSLGGDISAINVNPAGLGFYKTSDLVISPGFNFLNNKSNFRGTKAKDKASVFNLGTSGIVGGWQGSGRWTSKALSFAVTRTANFNNSIYYTGKNDFSSGAEQYAAEAASSGIDIHDIPDRSSVSFGTRMAVYNFLVDTTTLPGHSGPDVVSMSMVDMLRNGGPFLVNQSNRIETTGGITELALGYAANMDDKLYIGGSLGIPIVKYGKVSTFREEDATENIDNDFNYYELTEKYTTKGAGINFKLGMILKPAEFLRFGLAVHSPTWYSLTDTYSATMVADLDQFRYNPGPTSVTSTQLNGGVIPAYKYEIVSPWRFMLSGSYVLREIEDVRKQKGFLTADVEYVTYRSNRFRNGEDGDDNGYYDGVNDAVKNYYKGALNFRVGGELKFTTIMTRLGFSYYGDPYKDKELKGNKMYLSGGLGYRDAGIFIDLTYIYSIQKDISFPYRLPDKANTFANVNSNANSVMLTVGFKI
ncbi:MAG: aromatic hydrocarbon degradation protein [Chitinophagaceae bacterium]